MGYELKGAKKIIKHNDFDSIIRYLLNVKDKEKHVYFDIGANTGQSIHRFKKINDKSKIYSFEPTPHLFEGLTNDFEADKQVVLNNLGIGEKKGKLDFYSYKHHKINSLIPIDRESKFSKSRIIASDSNDQEFEKVIKVDVTDLDSYCQERNINQIDFIKIDTQGYETKILEGMQRLLKEQRISMIELELILGFGYEETISFYDYEKFLNKDYKLIALDTASNILSYSNYQTNLLYVKKEIFDSIREMHETNITIPGITEKTDKSHPFSY